MSSQHQQREGKTAAVITSLIEYVRNGGSLDDVAVFLSKETRLRIEREGEPPDTS